MKNGDAHVWPQAENLVGTAKFLFSEGHLGLLAAALVFVLPLSKEISSLFHFPPQARAIAKFLVATAAIATWKLTRAWLRTRTSKASHSKGGAATCANTLARSLLFRSGAAFVLAAALFCCYLTLSTALVSAPEEIAPEGLQRSGGSAVRAQVGSPLFEPNELFFHPIVPSAKFAEALEARGGYSFVKDNDQEWLRDKLAEEGMRVELSKLLLLAIALAASVTLTWSLTVISFLPQPAHTLEDAVSP